VCWKTTTTRGNERSFLLQEIVSAATVFEEL
jgi:hypothetical protein